MCGTMQSDDCTAFICKAPYIKELDEKFDVFWRSLKDLEN